MNWASQFLVNYSKRRVISLRSRLKKSDHFYYVCFPLSGSPWRTILERSFLIRNKPACINITLEPASQSHLLSQVESFSLTSPYHVNITFIKEVYTVQMMGRGGEGGGAAAVDATKRAKLRIILMRSAEGGADNKNGYLGHIFTVMRKKETNAAGKASFACVSRSEM